MDTSTNENRNDEESLQMPQNMSTDLPTSFETFGTAERCSSAAENNNNNSANRENDGENGTSQSSSAENVLQMTPHQQQNAVGEANEPGRRSTRVIKRPKFDDELVESIHNKIHHQPKVTPKRRQSHDKSVNNSYEEEQSRQSAHKRNSMVVDDKYLTPPTPAAETNTPIQQANSSKASRKRKAPESENTTNGSNKTTKKHHPHDENGSTTANQLNALADTAAKVNWTPEDDIALIAAVTHVSDLHVIYSQMNFSRRYTLDQIEERWYELLYDEKASQNARKRMESIDKKRILDILARIPFSMREEQLISQIPSTVPPPIQMHLERILEQNRDQFHHARTVQMLEEHWRELKSLYLLADQQPLQPQPDDFIEQTYDLQSLVGLDPISDQLPLDVEERQFTRNIAINEREVHEWEAVYTTAVTGIPATNPVMTSETIGLLCGRCTTFDIRKEKVLIGRSTKRHNVDVNLTLEGPTGMVSRKQAILKMSEGGECLLRNIGKKYLVVDGQVLVTGEAAKLTNNSLIEVAQIRLKFLKNAEYRPPRMRGEDGGQFINNQR